MNKGTLLTWLDRIIKILEILSFIFLLIPFGSMSLYILASTFLEGDYFFFFPTAMFLFLPAGLIAFLIQLLRVYRKHPWNRLNSFIFGFSLFSIIIGCLAWMAIYVVTGG